MDVAVPVGVLDGTGEGIVVGVSVGCQVVGVCVGVEATMAVPGGVGVSVM